MPPYVQKPPQPYATVPHPQFKKKETNFSFLVNINEIFLQLQVKSKIKLVFVAKIVFVRCGKMYLQELEACRGEVEQVDNGFGRGFVSHPRRMVGRWIP